MSILTWKLQSVLHLQQLLVAQCQVKHRCLELKLKIKSKTQKSGTWHLSVLYFTFNSRDAPGSQFTQVQIVMLVSSCICLGQSLRLQEDVHMFASLLWSNTRLRHSANYKCVLQVFEWSCIKKKPKIKTKEQLVISYVCRHLCPTVKQSWTMINMLTAVGQQQVLPDISNISGTCVLSLKHI